VLMALPYLFLLACPLLHLFGHGHRHGHGHERHRHGPLRIATRGCTPGIEGNLRHSGPALTQRSGPADTPRFMR
jgi:hypothetical protein